jgi:hypothetical protein
MDSDISGTANGVAVFNFNGINIRSLPRLDAPVVGQAFSGQQATLIGRASGDRVAGCDLWYLLTNVDTGVTGYVAHGAARFGDLVWTEPSPYSAVWAI